MEDRGVAVNQTLRAEPEVVKKLAFGTILIEIYPFPMLFHHSSCHMTFQVVHIDVTCGALPSGRPGDRPEVQAGGQAVQRLQHEGE